MIRKIKKAIKKMIYPNYYCNEAYVNYLRKKGGKIGERTFFYDIMSRPVDETSIALVRIGDDCRITAGAYILAHDYSYAVLRQTHHKMLCKTAYTTIGNNVFIGLKSIIMPGATIGNNVVVAAGSVVTGRIPDNVVIGGNPAKIICSLEEYHNKLLDHFEDYAVIAYKNKTETMGRPIIEKDMGWYNQLWSCEGKMSIYNGMTVDGDDKQKVIEDVMRVEPKYNSFDEFKSAHGLE